MEPELIMKRMTGVMAGVLMIALLSTGCSTFTFKGNNGEEAKVNLSDVKEGKMSVETTNEDGETQSMNIDVDEDDGSATITGDDGESIAVDTEDNGTHTLTMEDDDQSFESTTGEDAELPDGFPEDFPIPEDADITSSSTITEDDTTSYTVRIEIAGDMQDYYEIVKTYAEEKEMEAQLDQKSNTNGQKRFMFAAGKSDEGEANFSFNAGTLDEQGASITYIAPNH